VDELSPVSQLLKKARRRSMLDLVLDQSALAVSIAMGGAILLLLTGTSLLEWYWIALLAAASLAFGLYRFRGRVPTEYRLAQRIDWKMNLADALSTATYFSADEKPICAQQRSAAENVARTIDPKIAVPFTRSRFAWPAAGLALVACGLFAVRYAVTGTMSMEPSLVKMAYDTFFGAPQQQAKNNIRKQAQDKNSPLDPGNPDAPTTQNEQVPDSQLESVETPDVNNAMASDQSKEAAKGEKKSSADEAGENSEKGEKGEQASNGDEGNQDNSKQGDKSKDGKQKDGKQDAKNQNANNDSSSMLDKLKDAMANMMNKMKSNPPKESQSAQNSQDSKQGGQEKGNQKGAQNQKGSQNDSQDADAQSDQNQQQGDKSEKKQSANAKSGDKSQDKNNSPDAKSGIGSSDGDKAAKEAEQLAAMGKISEIIGKRSQNVTGEVMVEVGSTKQQLKTPWAQKQATHVEAGSEIHRDEVPLMYQQFVEQYFEEIRKGTESGAKPGVAAKPGDGKPTQKTPSP
jgi:hypothetical protein